MPKQAKRPALKGESQVLTGWQQIAAFLGHPAAVVQRWASEGMPVHREGRHVATTADDLNAWLLFSAASDPQKNPQNHSVFVTNW